MHIAMPWLHRNQTESAENVRPSPRSAGRVRAFAQRLRSGSRRIGNEFPGIVRAMDGAAEAPMDGFTAFPGNSFPIHRDLRLSTLLQASELKRSNRAA